MLYAHLLPLSEVTQEEARGTAGQQTAGQQTLNSSPSATPTGSSPAATRLAGVFGGAGAAELAAALAELGNPADDGYRTVPVFSEGEDPPPVSPGYYVVRDAQTEPVESSAVGPLARYDLQLQRVGTRQSRVRAAETSPTSLESDLGTAEQPTVAIPAGATAPLWHDAASERSVDATPTTTVSTAAGELAVYDPVAAPVADPTLLYDPPLARHAETDCVLWDRYGSPDKRDADGGVQWRPVYSRDHDPQGALVASTRRFRLLSDPHTGLLGAQEWTAADGWADVSLSATGWSVSTVDVAGVDPAVVHLQLWFQPPDGGPRHALDARLRRGADGVIWSTPANEQGPTPPGLVDLLAPTAADSYETADVTTTTTARSEVRR